MSLFSIECGAKKKVWRIFAFSLSRKYLHNRRTNEVWRLNTSKQNFIETKDEYNCQALAGKKKTIEQWKTHLLEIDTVNSNWIISMMHDGRWNVSFYIKNSFSKMANTIWKIYLLSLSLLFSNNKKWIKFVDNSRIFEKNKYSLLEYVVALPAFVNCKSITKCKRIHETTFV